MAVLHAFVWLLCFVVLLLLVNYLLKIRFGAAARQDAAQAADLFETAPVGYLELNRKGVVLRANRQYAKLLGRDRRGLVGRHCADLVPAFERERYRELMDRKLAGDSPLLAHQREYLRPDGSKVVVEVHEEFMRDQFGSAVGLRLAAIDVTGRKKSEQETYQIASELRALFQAFPDFFIRLDRDGKVLDAKGGQTSDPFLTVDKFWGHNLRDILPANAIQQFAESQDKLRKTKSTGIVEFTVDRPQGAQTYEMRLVAIDWEQWIAIVRNITARKRDEQKLKDYAQELERKNQEFESALIAAREATQLKSRFLANMSHEIRTPMNGVLGMTEFLLATPLTSEQHEYADAIKRSANSLLTLINDVLDLSRIEAGKMRLDHVPFSVRTILEEAISLFALQARAKGLKFVSEIAPNLPAEAVGDPERLRQVLTNLLGNAIKFTEQGRVGLVAELLSQRGDRIQLRFTVHDTGVGIPKEHHSRVFERFMQADTSSTRKYGGTGLGLSISKQLVELLGGEIGLESEPDRGSRFWFTASFQKAEDAAKAPSPAPARAEKATPKVSKPAPSAAPAKQADATPAPQAAGTKRDGLANLTAAVLGHARRVLLAEDNEINQRITLRLLRNLGIEADAVVNGRQAVEALQKKKYALVFMDCQMPEMDGFEATAVIRNQEGKQRHTPICALTANAMEGDRERCLSAGMDDYITKPLSVEKLREAVDRWIRSPGGTPATQPDNAASGRS
ncbi:MAG TPA: ATP-binding protein [Bryobacteraceae bacterium]|nr:ATP-binding protein [Bryobacteraceae bacterium]